MDLDRLRRLLPDIPERRSVVEHALRTSRPDPDDAWAATGEVATLGSRLVEPASLAEEMEHLALAEARRLSDLYSGLADVLKAAGSGDHGGVIRALLAQARAEERAGRPRESASFAEAAVEWARDAGLESVRALALRRLARAQRKAGRLDSALEHYDGASALSEALSDTPGYAESAIGAGNVLEQRGQWREAESRYRAALHALETLPEPTPAHWHVNLNLHLVLRSRGDIEGSQPWLARAQALATDVADPSAPTFLETARGQLAMAADAFEDAESRFLAALDHAETEWASGTILLNLAESALARGRVLDAAEHTREAERTALLGNTTSMLPDVYRMLGRAAAAGGNAEAFAVFERALELAGRGEGAAFQRAQTLQAYAEAEGALGRPDAAHDLWHASLQEYRTLGIAGVRRRWVDCFDASPPPDVQDIPSTATDTTS